MSSMLYEADVELAIKRMLKSALLICLAMVALLHACLIASVRSSLRLQGTTIPPLEDASALLWQVTGSVLLDP